MLPIAMELPIPSTNEDKKTANKDLDVEISLKDAVKKLSPREKLVLEERFVIGKTQMEISEELKISQAQVSRIEKSVMNNLRNILK